MIEIAANEGFLFWPRPALKLCLALSCIGKRRIDFDSKQCEGRIECGCSASLARDMVIKPLLQINRCSDVEHSGTQTQEIDDGHAPRQARGHSPRFGNQHIHGIRICRPQAMSKRCSDRASNGCPTWIRTRTRRVKVACATITPSGKGGRRKPPGPPRVKVGNLAAPPPD